MKFCELKQISAAFAADEGFVRPTATYWTRRDHERMDDYVKRTPL
jgi:hypothetical protein